AGGVRAAAGGGDGLGAPGRWRGRGRAAGTGYLRPGAALSPARRKGKGRLAPALAVCSFRRPASGVLGRGRGRGRRLRRRRLPAAGLALVLLLQPFLQRGEVLQYRAAVDPLAAGQLLERGLPRLAGAARQHGAELLAGGLAAVEAAFVQRAGVAGGLAQRLVELELQQVRQEIAGVRGIARHVVLGTRVEELLAARLHRGHALVARLQLPPGLVVAVRGDRAVEHAPAPAVDHQPERQERDLGQGHAHLGVDQRLVALRLALDQADRLQVLRRHRQHDGVADGLVEAVVGAVLEQRRL